MQKRLTRLPWAPPPITKTMQCFLSPCKPFFFVFVTDCVHPNCLSLTASTQTLHTHTHNQGLGKTMQCSAFLAGSLGAGAARRALIVAPKTLLAHW